MKNKHKRAAKAASATAKRAFQKSTNVDTSIHTGTIPTYKITDAQTIQSCLESASPIAHSRFIEQFEQEQPTLYNWLAPGGWSNLTGDELKMTIVAVSTWRIFKDSFPELPAVTLDELARVHHDWVINTNGAEDGWAISQEELFCSAVESLEALGEKPGEAWNFPHYFVGQLLILVESLDRAASRQAGLTN